jgi:hypothetical protein
MDEWRIQYGFHLFVFINCSNVVRSLPSVTDPLESKRSILFLKSIITVRRVSGVIGPPVKRLHISLAFGSFLNVCSLIQSRTYGKEHLSNAGAVRFRLVRNFTFAISFLQSYVLELKQRDFVITRVKIPEQR